MFHYLTFIWDSDDARSAETAEHFSQLLCGQFPAWQRVVHLEGMMVHSTRPDDCALRAYRLPAGSGIILGRLFKRKSTTSNEAVDSSLDENTTRKLIDTSGAELTRAYWGTYVAFLRDLSGSRSLVLRDCSGKLPCYRFHHRGIEIFFSDITDTYPLGLPAFSLNHEYLSAYIHSPDLQIRNCGISGITEVLAGECVEVLRCRARQFTSWDPRVICGTDVVDHHLEALEELKSTTQQCIDAWASTYRNIVLSLSGGFDSAVVLGCLSQAVIKPDITCFNSYGKFPTEDERYYARMAAARANVELIEQSFNSADRVITRDLLLLPSTPKPSILAFFAATNNDATNGIAVRRGADSVWTGEGGDHLFLELKTILSAVDYAARHGVDLGLLGAIADAARLSATPYISVLRKAFQLSGRPSHWSPDLGPYKKVCFVNRDSLPGQIDEYLSHPWNLDTGGVSLGKRNQIYFLADVVNRHRPLPGVQSVYQHHPLLSQPLMELCLRIPTYHLVRGGRDRALARMAFSDRVPAGIIQREDKGGAAFWMVDMLRRSMAFVDELLVDGILVRERLVNRDELRPHIQHSRPFRPEQLRPLFACVSAELWARAWKQGRFRAAA